MVETRNVRNTRQGIVVSTDMEKTVVVKVTYMVKTPKIGKVVKQTKKFKAHDEKNECGVGDTVLIQETRPLSKTKYHRVVKIIEKAKYSWDLTSRNVTHNAGRLRLKRYLAVMANKKLREKYFGF